MSDLQRKLLVVFVLMMMLAGCVLVGLAWLEGPLVGAAVTGFVGFMGIAGLDVAGAFD